MASISSRSVSTSGSGLVVVKLILVMNGCKTPKLAKMDWMSSPFPSTSKPDPSLRRLRISSFASHSMLKFFKSSSSCFSDLGRPLGFFLALFSTILPWDLLGYQSHTNTLKPKRLAVMWESHEIEVQVMYNNWISRFQWFQISFWACYAHCIWRVTIWISNTVQDWEARLASLRRRSLCHAKRAGSAWLSGWWSRVITELKIHGHFLCSC